MATFTVEVENVTFMVENDSEEGAVMDVYSILWDVAHDYSPPTVV